MSAEDIDQFIQITGADKEKAIFFLESSNNDVAAAIGNFYAQDGATSNNIRTVHGSSGPSNNNDQNNKNEYYAGGVNKSHGGGSGQSVLGPADKKAKIDPEKLIGETFEKARKAGAQTDEDLQNKKSSAFSGIFNSLTGQNNSEEVNRAREAEPITIVLKMWENGFSVDEGDNVGELRSYEDPESQKFLDDIKEGYIPKELIAKHKGGKINLDMEDHKDEPYKKPEKPAYIAFSGSGQALGASSSSTSTNTNCEVDENFKINVLKSKPTTNIQMRLAGNVTVRQQFNTSHTVGDLRKFMAQKSGKTSFKIMLAYPPKVLDDDSLTLEEANLLNASVAQR